MCTYHDPIWRHMTAWAVPCGGALGGTMDRPPNKGSQIGPKRGIWTYQGYPRYGESGVLSILAILRGSKMTPFGRSDLGSLIWWVWAFWTCGKGHLDPGNTWVLVQIWSQGPKYHEYPLLCTITRARAYGSSRRLY